jgi:hypothetical protein
MVLLISAEPPTYSAQAMGTVSGTFGAGGNSVASAVACRFGIALRKTSESVPACLATTDFANSRISGIRETSGEITLVIAARVPG